MMPLLVHLTPERNVSGIRRNGLSIPKHATGVYAMPVSPHFVLSHQWLRELKRNGARSWVGVYFRVPDDEPVLFGHFGLAATEMTEAQAVGRFLRMSDPLGMEVIVPRKVTTREIHRIRRLPSNLGWRYSPNVRGRAYCACVQCNPPGSIKAARKRRIWSRKQIGA
jgi:hypothetical protein